VNSVFAVQLFDRLSYLAKNLLAPIPGELRMILHQREECALEGGIDQNSFLMVIISVHPKPTGALRVACESLG
jgi:hypothetical protein